jgi:hypothetical protein
MKHTATAMVAVRTRTRHDHADDGTEHRSDTRNEIGDRMQRGLTSFGLSLALAVELGAVLALTHV